MRCVTAKFHNNLNLIDISAGDIAFIPPLPVYIHFKLSTVQILPWVSYMMKREGNKEHKTITMRAAAEHLQSNIFKLLEAGRDLPTTQLMPPSFIFT